MKPVLTYHILHEICKEKKKIADHLFISIRAKKKWSCIELTIVKSGTFNVKLKPNFFLFFFGYCIGGLKPLVIWVSLGSLAHPVS